MVQKKILLINSIAYTTKFITNLEKPQDYNMATIHCTGQAAWK